MKKLFYGVGAMLAVLLAVFVLSAYAALWGTWQSGAQGYAVTDGQSVFAVYHGLLPNNPYTVEHQNIGSGLWTIGTYDTNAQGVLDFQGQSVWVFDPGDWVQLSHAGVPPIYLDHAVVD